MALRNRGLLDTGSENEIILEILSYTGGENTMSEDHVTRTNEGRIVENWEAISQGGMERAKGFNMVASAGGASASDLAFFHYEDTGGGSAFLGAFNGAIVKKDGTGLSSVSGSGFTADILSHGASGEDDSWFTNSTDNLRRYTIAGGWTTPSDQPAAARERIYRHKNRLIAEGGGTRIYGSRVGAGNWTAADAWTLANDAWDIDAPNTTKGCAPGFPSGGLVAVFDKFRAYLLSGFPNVRLDPIPNSRGCAAPLSIAQGDDGLFFLSDYPTLGVFFWNGTSFINITNVNEDEFVDKIDMDNRIFGVYKNKKYYLIYNEKSSGVTYPNRMRVFNTEFGRWMNRPPNADLADNFGYPATLGKQANELYVWSSRNQKIFELETTDNSDEGNDTEANYKTKDFSSRDFLSAASGKSVPIDEGMIKISKITITYFGTTGVVTLLWTADRGRASGSLTFDLTAEGDKINDNFTVNSSKIVAAGSLTDKRVTKSVSNAAVGQSFNFQLLHNGASTRPKIKKIKIHALLLTED